MYCRIIKYNLIIKFECNIIKKKYLAHNNFYLFHYVAQSSQKVGYPWSRGLGHDLRYYFYYFIVLFCGIILVKRRNVKT